MRRCPLHLLAGALLVGCTAAGNAAEPAWPQGIFSDVEMSAESGDLGGFEVRFYEEGGRHMAEFVLCEGWCNSTFHSEVRREGVGFVFEADQEWLDSNGNITLTKLRFRVIPSGNRLLVEGWLDDHRFGWEEEKRNISPQENLFGIDVARFKDDDADQP